MHTSVTLHIQAEIEGVQHDPLDENARIAEQVFGWQRHDDPDLGTWWTLPVSTPFPEAQALGAPYYYRKTLPDFVHDEVAQRLLAQRLQSGNDA